MFTTFSLISETHLYTVMCFMYSRFDECAFGYRKGDMNSGNKLINTLSFIITKCGTQYVFTPFRLPKAEFGILIETSDVNCTVLDNSKFL